MKYMLLMKYEGGAACDVPMGEWAPEDITTHLDFQRSLGKELAERGELVEAQGLTGPELARVVTSDGRSAPVVTDGPFPESKEFLAGYWIVDVESPDRSRSPRRRRPRRARVECRSSSRSRSAR